VTLSSVAAGAVAWVLFASKTGLPAQGAGQLHWSFLAKRVALPLGLSPLLALALIFAVLLHLRRGLSRVDGYCVCIERTEGRISIAGTGALAMSGVSTAEAPPGLIPAFARPIGCALCNLGATAPVETARSPLGNIDRPAEVFKSP
jgi:hypothetical protein